MKNSVILLCLFLSTSLVFGQSNNSKEQLKSDLKIKLVGEAKPDLYIDGKKVDYMVFELLDHDKIASVNVIKGQRAIDEFNAPQGVLQVTTHAYASVANKILSPPGTNMTQRLTDLALQPLILINDKEATRAQLENLDPKDIESITVLKDAAAVARYNAKNGVILITLKK